MPSTTDYYNALKIQLDAQAASKKAALDLAYERATTAQFDAQGNMSRKAGKGPGTLDVQFDEQQRQISTGAESSGTLKSGQFGRDLATSQAAYRTAVVSGAAETEAAKTAISDESASELAKYQAMYGNPTASGGSGGSSGGGGTPAGSSPVNDSLKDIKPPPGFTLNPNKVTTPLVNRTDASGNSGMGASSSIKQNKQITSAVTKKPAPVKKAAPVKLPAVKKPVGAWDR